MKFYSTRDALRQRPYSLKEAAFLGLAPDGGLFMPEYIPQVDLAELETLAEKSYADMAIALAKKFFGDDVPSDKLEAMVRRAYDFPCPLVRISPEVRTLELFHGPTYAFKDFGARFMGGMLSILNDSSDTLTVLTATSGDTGSAVAAGFYKVPGVRVVVLYPEGKVSPLQESQMTTLGKNIYPVRVRGTFDDCQALVKGIFNDSEFRSGINVTSANSINILRWIPQSFYYFYGYFQWKKDTGKDRPDIVVPSGNYGNITAGMLAEAMGLPVRKFVCGSNANDVIPEFLRTGVYSPRPSVRTIANAMDVGAPSNYERMMYLYGNNFEKLKASLEGYSFLDCQIKKSIKYVSDYFVHTQDPHSAVGYLAYSVSGADGFTLSTAHPAKFPEVIKEATGTEPEMPEGLLAAMEKEKVYAIMDNDINILKAYITTLQQDRV